MKPMRVFRLYFECLECTAVGSEWTLDALTICEDWCPNCGLKAEPYSSETLWDEYQDSDEDEEVVA